MSTQGKRDYCKLISNSKPSAVTSKYPVGWYLLIGEFFYMQCHRAGFITLLVVLWDIHVPLCVPGVIRHPDCNRGTCYGNLPDKYRGAERVSVIQRYNTLPYPSWGGQRPTAVNMCFLVPQQPSSCS